MTKSELVKFLTNNCGFTLIAGDKYIYESVAVSGVMIDTPYMNTAMNINEDTACKITIYGGGVQINCDNAMVIVMLEYICAIEYEPQVLSLSVGYNDLETGWENV